MNAFLAISLLVLGFFWKPAWLILVVLVLAQWSERRWKELLDAIRGRQSAAAPTGPSSANDETGMADAEVDPIVVERALARSDYKHIPGQPWGDPSFYIKASPEELNHAAEALRRAEVERRESEAAEQERKRVDEEARNRQAREFLVREAEIVLREREQREARRKNHEPDFVPTPPSPLVIVRSPSEEAASEVCKCGYPGCLGHEVIDNHAVFPGFTSEAAMIRSPHQLVCFNVEMEGVAGNPSDGAIPQSAIRIRRAAQPAENQHE
jgi:hypothetical protein